MRSASLGIWCEERKAHMIMYHGSPELFDRFDLSRAGGGTGIGCGADAAAGIGGTGSFAPAELLPTGLRPG